MLTFGGTTLSPAEKCRGHLRLQMDDEWRAYRTDLGLCPSERSPGGGDHSGQGERAGRRHAQPAALGEHEPQGFRPLLGIAAIIRKAGLTEIRYFAPLQQF